MILTDCAVVMTGCIVVMTGCIVVMTGCFGQDRLYCGLEGLYCGYDVYPLIQVILAVIQVLGGLPYKLHMDLRVKLATLSQLQLQHKAHTRCLGIDPREGEDSDARERLKFGMKLLLPALHTGSAAVSLRCPMLSPPQSSLQRHSSYSPD